MNSANYLLHEGSLYPSLRKQQTMRRSSFEKPSQAFASLTNIDLYYNATSINRYTHPSSNNPTFFSPPTKARYDTAASSHASLPSLPFPITSPQCSVDMSLWTDFDSQLASDFGTPSPASSSSPHLAITPMSLYDEGQTMIRVDSRGILEFDGEQKYVNPHGFPSLAAALESDSESATKFSGYPRPSAATPHPADSTWQFENAGSTAWSRDASRLSLDAVSHTRTERLFHKETRPQDDVQSPALVYPKDKLIYTPVLHAPASPFSSGVSSPLVSPLASQISSRSSRFLPPLSSTASRFACQIPIPLHQPQPIRPIPIIPLSDISSSASDDSSTSSNTSQAQTGSTYENAETSDSHSTTDLLSPFSLLCQPVSDSIRYQFRAPSVTDIRRSTSGTFSASGDNTADHYYSNGLPKTFGGFFCVCGCLGLKHNLQSDAANSAQV